MKRTPGNIKLPITQVVQIGANDIQALDFLFDMNVPGLCQILEDEHEYNLPGLMIVQSQPLRIVALVFFMPPPGIRLFNRQQYLIYAGGDIIMLTDYFQSWSEYNQEPYLHPILLNAYHMLKLRGPGSRKMKYVTEPI